MSLVAALCMGAVCASCGGWMGARWICYWSVRYCTIDDEGLDESEWRKGALPALVLA